MKTKSYNKLKKSPIYKSYLAIGLADTTTQSQLEKGTIEFTDHAGSCTYRFYTKTGNARRYREATDSYKSVSYQLNPKVTIPGRGGKITFREPINGTKKLLTQVFPQVIKYNSEKTTEYQKRTIKRIVDLVI